MAISRGRTPNMMGGGFPLGVMSLGRRPQMQMPRMQQLPMQPPPQMPSALPMPTPSAGILSNPLPRSPGRIMGGFDMSQAAPLSSAPTEPQREDPPLPPVKKRGGRNMKQQLMKQLKFGIRHGGPMGAMAGFMGMPWMQKSGHDWNTYNPLNRQITPGGFSNMNNYGNNGSGTGGDGSGGGNGTGGGGGGSGDSGLPGDKFGKNLIPQWWKDWYKAEGQYGGVPPVQGIL